MMTGTKQDDPIQVPRILDQLAVGMRCCPPRITKTSMPSVNMNGKKI